MRHLMYGFALLMLAGTPLLPGSLWGLTWLTVMVSPLVARTLSEEAALRKALAGYEDYTRRVRRRLVPGIW
ncbi:isoprenylcysteine carboxyl methyltransferase [Methylorubrum populi]|uniref:Isoprenylcysteine carboxyl methyltransferase n=1 Tax=Methylorubrum populi TaxID=223967 RepID=A0A169QEJ3_9HYPH|nr:isoprenylcysteine carboxyl methyltransferase [Methylorubrum populi]